MCECVSVSKRVCVSSAWLQQAWLTNTALEAPRTVVPRTFGERPCGALLDEPVVGAQGCRCEPGPVGGFVLSQAKPCLTGTTYTGGGLLCLKPSLGKWGVAASWRGGFPRGPQPASLPCGEGATGESVHRAVPGESSQTVTRSSRMLPRENPLLGRWGTLPLAPNAGVSGMRVI